MFSVLLYRLKERHRKKSIVIRQFSNLTKEIGVGKGVLDSLFPTHQIHFPQLISSLPLDNDENLSNIFKDYPYFKSPLQSVLAPGLRFPIPSFPCSLTPVTPLQWKNYRLLSEIISGFRGRVVLEHTKLNGLFSKLFLPRVNVNCLQILPVPQLYCLATSQFHLQTQSLAFWKSK